LLKKYIFLFFILFSEIYEEDEEDDDEEDLDETESSSGRVVTTVPAREPKMDAQPLKPALKKPRDLNGRQQQDKSQNSRYTFYHDRLCLFST